jgi:hypothetical protein
MKTGCTRVAASARAQAISGRKAHPDRGATVLADGVTKKVWEVINIIDVLEIWERLKTRPWYDRLVVLQA